MTTGYRAAPILTFNSTFDLILTLIAFQDQFDRVTDHTLRGIEFCEKYSHFVKDRAKIENEYASALRYVLFKTAVDKYLTFHKVSSDE